MRVTPFQPHHKALPAPRFSAGSESALLPWPDSSRIQLTALVHLTPYLLEKPAEVTPRLIQPLNAMMADLCDTFQQRGETDTLLIRKSIFVPILRHFRDNLTRLDRDELLTLLAVIPQRYSRALALYGFDMMTPERQKALLQTPVNPNPPIVVLPGGKQGLVSPVKDIGLAKVFGRYQLLQMGYNILEFRRVFADPQIQKIRQQLMQSL